ncbi:MAG: type IV pilus twitching motility protein PilT [Erysipelotrichaceae bacterium]
MDKLLKILSQLRDQNGSDLHLCESHDPMIRIKGKLVASGYDLHGEEVRNAILSMLGDRYKDRIADGKDIDFTFAYHEDRYRVNVYWEREHLCAAVRVINHDIPTLEQLQMPPILKKLCSEQRGLIIVSGPTGSGKSTTLASMVNEIQQNQPVHILTIEDPIEYVYPQGKAMIHQREIERDVESFSGALRSAMREDPDVILVGEMRDVETISAAVTAAETGHLVLSTLHTMGAAKTIDRIIDVFPPHKQDQIRTQLSGVLKAVISQQLMLKEDNSGRIAVNEILIGSDAVHNLIRENKCHQLGTLMQMGASEGMHTLNRSLANRIIDGSIALESGLKASYDTNELMQYLNS